MAWADITPPTDSYSAISGPSDSYSAISAPSDTYAEIDREYDAFLLHAPVLTLDTMEDGQNVLVIDFDELWPSLTAPTDSWSNI